jgi:hypothetical protein
VRSCRSQRLIAAFQATVTTLAVLVASHHRAVTPHAQNGTGALVHVAAAVTAAVAPGVTSLSGRRGEALDEGDCLLCAASAARVIASARIELTAQVVVAAVPILVDTPRGAPPAALWLTAPKTSPPV